MRIFDTGGKGGFKGNRLHFDYFPVDSKLKTLSSAGEWKYKKGSAFQGEPFDAPGNSRVGPNDYPSLLFNAMINPITNFAIKGAIWYQGESNASRAYQYRRVFPAMITDWRDQWGSGDFPFYFVQLANFRMRKDEPTESEWAELREAQTMTLSLPNTGMATIIDIGEADDIHPRNKRDVGKRLAMNALALTYAQQVEYSGPMYESHVVEGNKMIIRLKHAVGMYTSDEKEVKGFTIAGEDQIFYNADAVIEDGMLIVSSPSVAEPVAVRYAWADNPATNLYNSAALPMVPFRTDTWPGITKDAK
jgi:sialate O-acetylesterase